MIVVAVQENMSDNAWPSDASSQTLPPLKDSPDIEDRLIGSDPQREPHGQHIYVGEATGPFAL